MNSKKIQPISSWSPDKGIIIIDSLLLNDFYHYHFDNGGGKVSYSLSGIDANTNSSINYFSGVVDVPSSIIQQWGADDDIIWDYVANTLGLILV